MNVDWLSPALKEEVRQRYEPRYGRQLSSTEVEEIAFNLTELAKVYCEWKLKENETSNNPNRYS